MKVNYCQLSVHDECRHRGIELINGSLKSSLRFAGWGRSLFNQISFTTALEKALQIPGPLIINLANRADETGDFYDYDPQNDRYVKVTPEIFWHGLPGSHWSGLKNILNNKDRQSSTIYLVVWQCNGLKWADHLCNIAGNQLPSNFNVFGSEYAVTPAMFDNLSTQKRAAAEATHYLELEDICRLICQREKLAIIIDIANAAK